MSKIEPIITREQFISQVSSAYLVLYDFVKLRRLPLAELLFDATDLSSKERGWQLHQLLVGFVDELTPSSETDLHSQEWRWHRIMQRRYIDTLSPQEVAEELALSRRQYFREQANAIEAVSDLILNKFSLQFHQAQKSNAFDLVHDEAARHVYANPQVNVLEILNDIAQMLKNVLTSRNIQVDIERSEYPIVVILSKQLLRQAIILLLGAVRSPQEEMLNLVLVVNAVDEKLVLFISSYSSDFLLEDELNVLSTVNQILEPAGGYVEIEKRAEKVVKIAITLPYLQRETLLLIDDNEELVSLFERLLSPYPYQIISIPNTTNIIEIAQQTKPYAIFMDLMMPDHDGWELLDLLVRDPSTSRFPVIICSVLKQHELAAALGASGFLEKPITETGLVSVLNSLRQIEELR
ncbi:MAG: response regulator [Anaerolineaceae bacterium]|nr:response regulator [Anaerolineaceae bacterium]